MSAGNFLGSMFISVMASALWIVLGAALDKIGVIFNRTINILPSFQDALNGFRIQQVIWMVLLIIIWGAIWFNYVQNEANEAGGLV